MPRRYDLCICSLLESVSEILLGCSGLSRRCTTADPFHRHHTENSFEMDVSETKNWTLIYQQEMKRQCFMFFSQTAFTSVLTSVPYACVWPSWPVLVFCTVALPMGKANGCDLCLTPSTALHASFVTRFCSFCHRL